MSQPLRPLRKNVIVKIVPKHNTSDSVIHLLDDDDSNEAIVLAVGSEVDEVAGGDRVILNPRYKGITTRVDNMEVIVMDINEVFAVRLG